MKKPQYKFHIDEPRPQIPEAPGFNQLLKNVKAVKPWYARNLVWGGTIVTAIAGVLLVYLNLNPKTVVPKTQSPAPSQVAQPLIPAADASKPQSQKFLFENLNKISADSPAFAMAPVLPWQAQNAEAPLVTINIPIKKADIPEVQFTAFTWFGLPYTSVDVGDISRPLQFRISGNQFLDYPANAWVHPDGTPATGMATISYREARNSAEMLVAGISFQHDGDSRPNAIENNGAFEIIATQNGKPLQIASKSHLLMYFKINQHGIDYSGMQFNTIENAWDPMYVGEALNLSDSTYHPHAGYRLRRESGFWAWLRSLFHKPVYDKLPDEIAGENNKGNIIKDRSVSKNLELYYRTFEIRQTGWFASGRNLQLNGLKSMVFSYATNTTDSTNNAVYQVFPNHNAIVKCESPKPNQIVVYANPAEPSYLIAFCKNRNRVALLTPDKFQSEVKPAILSQGKGMRSATDRNLTLEVNTKAIKDLQDLINLLQSLQGI